MINYLLHLTICTIIITPFGITKDCVTTTPASYSSKALCQKEGNTFVKAASSNTTTASFTCEKQR
jgi:hypothetical protein